MDPATHDAPLEGTGARDYSYYSDEDTEVPMDAWDLAAQGYSSPPKPIGYPAQGGARPIRKTAPAGAWSTPEPRYLSITVTALRGEPVQAVVKPLERSSGWVVASPPLAPEEVVAVYRTQTQAVGRPYNDSVAWNLVMGYIQCPRAATPTTGTAFSCSELVAASLRGTRLEMVGVPPSTVSPEVLMNHVLRAELRAGESLRMPREGGRFGGPFV